MSRSAAGSIETPIQYLRLSLEDEIVVEYRDNRILRGKLHAYDEHFNLLLGPCEETITRTETNAAGEKTKTKEVVQHPMLFVRGDGVVIISNSFQ